MRIFFRLDINYTAAVLLGIAAVYGEKGVWLFFMGIGNIGNMMKVMNAWNTFKQNHPKFPAFCSAVSKRGIREGSILEVTYISPEGEKLTTNIKVQQSDIELLRELSGGN